MPESQAEEKEPSKKKKDKKDRAAPRKNNRRRRKATRTGSTNNGCYSPRTDCNTSDADSVVSAIKDIVGNLVPEQSMSPLFEASLDNMHATAAANPFEGETIRHPAHLESIMTSFDKEVSDENKKKWSKRNGHLTPGPSPSISSRTLGLWDLWGRGWEHLLPVEQNSSEQSYLEAAERHQWHEWAIAAAEEERQRRIREIEEEESRERKVRQAWALNAVETERRRRTSQYFLDAISTTAWFTDTISSFCAEYDVVCPYSHLGCNHICRRKDLECHLLECSFKNEEDMDGIDHVDVNEYEVMCPYSILGCVYSCPRHLLQNHLDNECSHIIKDDAKIRADSLKIVKQQSEEERARRVDMEKKGEWQLDEKALHARQFLHTLLSSQVQHAVEILHFEINEYFCQISSREHSNEGALKELIRLIQNATTALWPTAVVRLFGSAATGLLSEGSDIDLVVCTGNAILSVLNPKHSDSYDGSFKLKNRHQDTPAEDSDASKLIDDVNISNEQKHSFNVQTLAQHLSTHLQDFEVSTVVDHGRIPIIRAKASSQGIVFNVDISLDCPGHTGLTTTSLVACLSTYLQSLSPLAQKGVVQSEMKVEAEAEMNKSNAAKDNQIPKPGCSSSRKISPLHLYPPVSPRVLQQWKVQWEKPLYQIWLGWQVGQRIVSHCHLARSTRVSAAAFLRNVYNVSPPPPAKSNITEDQEESGSNSTVSGIDSSSQYAAFAKPSNGPEEISIACNEKPVLGKLLLDFLQLFGQDFDPGKEGISIRGGGFKFQLQGNPAHPQAADPLVIEDPLDMMNNAGRCSYGFHDVQRCFSDALTTLKSAMVRVDCKVANGNMSSSRSTGANLHLPASRCSDLLGPLLCSCK